MGILGPHAHHIDHDLALNPHATTIIGLVACKGRSNGHLPLSEVPFLRLS
jgi:hypothetical protein